MNASHSMHMQLKQNNATAVHHTQVEIDDFAIILLFIAYLAGKFSLSRFDIQFIDAFWLSNIVYWFTLPLVCLAMVLIYKYNFRWISLPWNYKAIVISIIALYGYMSLSTIWAPFPDIELAIEVCMIPLFVALLHVFLSYRPERQIKLLFLLTFWAGFIYALAGVVLGGHGADRMAVFGGGPNVFIRIVGSGLIASLYLYFIQRKRIAICAIPIMLYAAIASGSRGGLIALLLSLIFLLVFILSRHFTWRTVILMLIVLGLLTYIGYTIILTNEIQSLARDRYYTLTIEKQYLSGRDLSFSQAWWIFLENPLVGAGLGGYISLSSYAIYPHNIVLHLAAEGGMLGLMPLFFISILMVRRWFQPRSAEHGIALTLCILYFISSLASGGLYDSRFIWFYGIIYMLPLKTCNSGTGKVFCTQSTSG
jgi:O-antigen ligase